MFMQFSALLDDHNFPRIVTFFLRDRIPMASRCHNYRPVLIYQYLQGEQLGDFRLYSHKTKRCVNHGFNEKRLCLHRAYHALNATMPSFNVI